MEYCGGGSVADLMNMTDKPLEEYQIAYICREAIKVISVLMVKTCKYIKRKVVSLNFRENLQNYVKR